MKPQTTPFEQAISLESLLVAWDEFKVGKRMKNDVQAFEYRLSDNLFALHDELVSKTYTHAPYEAFYIHDPKVRLIHKATVRDRVVHHALYQALNPLFEPTFIFDSYSCRTGKGTHRAVKRLKVFTEKVMKINGTCFVLKCDIRKFFRSIDHAILFETMEKRVEEPDMLWLIQILIHSFPPAARIERERESGCPIGNLTSQLFANIYMNVLDQFMKHALKEKYYIRYTDDFVIVHHNREHLERLQIQIEKFLHDTLKLSLHPDKVSIRKYSQGIDFLGYVVHPSAITLRTKTKNRITRKIHERAIQFKREIIGESALVQTFASYMGVLEHANTHKLKQEIEHDVWTVLKSFDRA